MFSFPPFVRLFLSTTLLFLAAKAPAQNLSDALQNTALLDAQKDGVIYLPSASAACVRWGGRRAEVIPGGTSALRCSEGKFVRWSGDSERPAWRMRIPASGWYRVLITETTPAGEDHSVSVVFTRPGQHERTLTKTIASSASPELQAFEIGEVMLEAGEQTVDYKPLSWISPYHQGRLADVRLIPLDPLRKLERAAVDAMKHMGVDQAPEIAARVAAVAEKQKEAETLNRETRRRDFSTFTTYQQFLDFDREPARLLAAQQALMQAQRVLAAARIQKASSMPEAQQRLKPTERESLENYVQASAQIQEAGTKSYSAPAAPVAQTAAAPRTTLFPVGHFEDLPPQAIAENKPRVEIALVPPADAKERQARFIERDSPAGLAALSTAFAKVLVPGTPGLEEFEKLNAAGHPAEALAAYRDYFFAKLAHPERYGAVTENILFELARDRGKGELLLRPAPWVVEKNMQGIAVADIGKEVVTGAVGAPGSAAWVPLGLSIPASAANDGRIGKDPFWQSEAGKDARRKLEFFRYLHSFPGDRQEYFGGGFFPALLWSYALTGNRAHLDRWCEYADDFTMHVEADQEALPFDTRNATELETQEVRATLNLLRIIIDERPDLARDFHPATLARLMMYLVAEYAPYTIRARRTEMANWGIMGLCHQVHLSRFLAEFKAEAYFNRECWRLWNANMIQHRTPDGENIEAWDDGHNYVTQEFSRESLPFARWPAEVDRWDLTDLWDQLRVDQRSKLIHVSPGGFYWPYWEAKYPRAWTTIEAYHRPDAAGGEAFNLIETEPEAQHRLHTLMERALPNNGPAPDHFSDHAPYASMSYLRSSWSPTADYFVLQNFRTRSQAQADCSRTMYSLARNDRVLVEAHGLVVDGKPDNRYQDSVRTGGKTDFCAPASRQVWPERFHTSARFDFAEGLQDAPYSLPRISTADPFGLYRTAAPAPDPQPITDVKVLRQCFGVRGSDLWLVCDRIQSPKEHEYTQFFSLPIRLGETGFADRLRLLAESHNPLVEVDEKAGVVRTLNPGFENVALHCFGPTALQFASTLDSHRALQNLPGSALQRLQTALQAGRLPEKSRNHLVEPVAVHWRGQGNQVFIAALLSRASNDHPAENAGGLQQMEKIAGPGGVLGCHGVTAQGLQVWLVSGPESVNDLQCDKLQARGETLLLTQAAGQNRAGIALGCVQLGDRHYSPAADFEFELDAQGRVLKTIAIHRPLGTARILPDREVFTDALDISFVPPPEAAPSEVDLHYTLDGSDPTLESPRYTAPFRIAATTMVKVRAFRKGLNATPWTCTGTDSGRTIAAIFRKRPLLPAVAEPRKGAGLHYTYFEGDWPALFSYAGESDVLPAKSEGVVGGLLQPQEIAAMRKTDRAYAIRYDGFVTVPESGVYTLFAPNPLFTATRDAGYDLRVFVDDQEWLPSARAHATDAWSIPLAAGAHRLRVAYVDYRWKQFRNDYWMAWQPEEIWAGTPVLEIESARLSRQPIPRAWLSQ